MIQNIIPIISSCSNNSNYMYNNYYMMLQKKGNINWDRTGKDIGKHKEGNNQHKALTQRGNNMIKDMKRLPKYSQIILSLDFAVARDS